MKYVRATIDPTTHAIAMIEAYDTPMTSAPPRLTWCTAITVEVGAFEDDVFPEGVSVAQYLLDRLEFHPGSATVRTKPGITDLPTAHASPASLQGLKTRLNASGKRHGLPAPVATHLCELLATREDTKAVHLAALGMSSAEIRALQGAVLYAKWAEARSAAERGRVMRSTSAVLNVWIAANWSARSARSRSTSPPAARNHRRARSDRPCRARRRWGPRSASGLR